MTKDIFGSKAKKTSLMKKHEANREEKVFFIKYRGLLLIKPDSLNSHFG